MKQPDPEEIRRILYGDSGQQLKTMEQPQGVMPEQQATMEQPQIGPQQPDPREIQRIMYGDNVEELAPTATAMLKQQMEQTMPSPLSFIERVQLSFADDTGRERWLKDRYKFVERLSNGKFAVGNDPRDMRPIDPEGIFNDVLGDFADVVGAIPIIAGQIMGTTLGAAGGALAGGVGAVPGAIAGSAAGAMGGELISKLIGKSMGVNEQDAMGVATDLAIQGIFSGAGEGVAQALSKFTGSILKPNISKFFDKALKESNNPGRTLSTVAQIMKIGVGVDTTDTAEIGIRSFNKGLSAPFTNKNYSRTLTTDLINGVTERTKGLGRIFEAAEANLKKTHSEKILPIRDLGFGLINTLKSGGIEVIDQANRLNKEVLLSPEKRAFAKLLLSGKRLFNINKVDDSIMPKNISVIDYINYKKIVKPEMESLFSTKKITAPFKRAIDDFFDQVDTIMAKSTTDPTKLAATGGNVEMANPYYAANKAYGIWKQQLEMMKDNGLDLTKPFQLSKMKMPGTGNEVLAGNVADFIEGWKGKSTTTKDTFRELVSQLSPRHNMEGIGVGGTIGNLYDKVVLYNAAQSFTNVSPNILRVSSIMSMAGLGAGWWVGGKVSDNPLSKPLGALVGYSMLSPAGAARVLKIGERLTGKAGGTAMRTSLDAERIGLANKGNQNFIKIMLQKSGNLKGTQKQLYREAADFAQGQAIAPGATGRGALDQVLAIHKTQNAMAKPKPKFSKGRVATAVTSKAGSEALKGLIKSRKRR